MTSDARCSFCGKTQDQARVQGHGGLVAGKGLVDSEANGNVADHPAAAYICGECAALAVSILSESTPS